MTLASELLTDPELFVARCRKWVDTADSPYHTLLSIAFGAIDGYSSFKENAVYGIVTKGGEVSGCWIQIRDGQIYLPNLGPDEVRVVCDVLLRDSYAINTVSAPEETALQFSESWSALTGTQLKPKSRWQVMVASPPLESAGQHRGQIQLAAADARATIEAWSRAYELERPAPMSIADFLLGKQERGELYLWVDDEPVAMLATTTRIEERARLVALYTPTRFRRNGYGSMLVSQTTKLLLDRGFSSCAVSFDTSDEFLGDLYASIGYRYAEKRQELTT